MLSESVGESGSLQETYIMLNNINNNNNNESNEEIERNDGNVTRGTARQRNAIITSTFRPRTNNKRRKRNS